MGAWIGRHKWFIFGGIAILAVVLLFLAVRVHTDVTAGKAAGTPREHMMQLTNDARARANAGQLESSRVANIAAHLHSVRMANNHSLYHSCCLTHDLRNVKWFVWGENVGVGTNVFGLFKAFMASPDHRANMLDTRFTHVGIGFHRHGHILWVTMIFFG